MRVLGLDPGTATTGFGVIDAVGNRLSHVEHGVISTPAGENFARRLQSIFDQVVELTARVRPDAVAIEQIYFTKNITTGIGVAQARGVIALAVTQAGCPIAEFSPRDVKKSITSNGRADKRQMQAMIKVLLNLDEVPKPDDAADALGVAICQVHAHRFQTLTTK